MYIADISMWVRSLIEFKSLRTQFIRILCQLIKSRFRKVLTHKSIQEFLLRIMQRLIKDVPKDAKTKVVNI